METIPSFFVGVCFAFLEVVGEMEHGFFFLVGDVVFDLLQFVFEEFDVEVPFVAELG